MAPGPTPDLDDVGAGLDEVAGALRRDHVAGDDRHARVERAHGPQRVEHLLLVAVRGVDDEHVGAGVEQVLGLGRDVAVDADRGGDAQPPGVVEGGGVEVRAQRPGPGEDADQPPVVGHDRGEPAPRVRQGVEGRLDVDAVVERHHVADHDVLELGEPVDPGEVGLGDDADRAVADGDDGRTVGALVQQHQRLADGRGGGRA